MPKVTQLAVTLANKAGALAQLCSTLGKAGVNISALVAPEIRGRGKVRLLVGSPDKAKEAPSAAKLRFSEEEVIAMELDNRPNALGEVVEKLAQARSTSSTLMQQQQKDPQKPPCSCQCPT